MWATPGAEVAAMDEQRSRLGYLVPVICFVAFFMACCGVCACVFARAASQTAQAESLNTAVQLCRNTAEICRSGEGWEDGESLDWYDGTMRLSETGAYWVAVTRTTAENGLGTARIRAGKNGAEALYTLEIRVYLPERGR